MAMLCRATGKFNKRGCRRSEGADSPFNFCPEDPPRAPQLDQEPRGAPAFHRRPPARADHARYCTAKSASSFGVAARAKAAEGLFTPQIDSRNSNLFRESSEGGG